MLTCLFVCLFVWKEERKEGRKEGRKGEEGRKEVRKEEAILVSHKHFFRYIGTLQLYDQTVCLEVPTHMSKVWKI